MNTNIHLNKRNSVIYSRLMDNNLLYAVTFMMPNTMYHLQRAEGDILEVNLISMKLQTIK